MSSGEVCDFIGVYQNIVLVLVIDKLSSTMFYPHTPGIFWPQWLHLLLVMVFFST